MDSGMFYGIQKGAITALKSTEAWFDRLNTLYRDRRKLILELADKLNCSYDKSSVGMFVWAKLPEGSPSAEAFIDEVLYEKNVFITPGTIFGSNGEGYIRFSLCVTEDKVREAIGRF
jgi:aspartate/methionine/tyrosine aminotransferase